MIYSIITFIWACCFLSVLSLFPNIADILLLSIQNKIGLFLGSSFLVPSGRPFLVILSVHLRG